MSALTCPRCQRINPGVAAFCYFDGAELRPAQGRPDPTQLPHDFVFPSGRRCKTYDDLVQGCQYEWDDARDLLRQGIFTHFLAGIGRMDLARAAQEAQAQAEADIALHEFVARLPAQQVQGPKLDLHPRRLMLGTLRAGETRQVQLLITNQGKGLLRGTLTVTDAGSWLRLSEGDGHCSIMTAREQQITLWLSTHGLAAPAAYTAKLTVITNGGVVEVPVRVDLIAQAFPRAPFQRVGTPREMAERMRSQPKAAVPLLESGEVAHWFEANGWTYPVQGPTAAGVAAVQQFFEGMGLSKPPPVQLSDSEAGFTCQPPEVVGGQVTVRTGAKKWVYGQADSDAPWLRVTTPVFSGPQQAVVGYEVDSSLMDEGRVHEGIVNIVANAGQRLALRIRVDVRRPHEPFTRRLLRPFLAGALVGLLYRLLLAGPADLYARVLAAAPTASPPPGSFASWLESPFADVGFLKHFVLATWWLGAVVGAVVLWRRGGRWADVVCGIIAGAAAGLAGSATFACLLPLLDGLPRALWHMLAANSGSVGAVRSQWLGTVAWIALAGACWAAMGSVLGGVLSCAGRRGLQFLARVAQPLSWGLRLCGWKGAGTLFGLE